MKQFLMSTAVALALAAGPALAQSNQSLTPRPLDSGAPGSDPGAAESMEAPEGGTFTTTTGHDVMATDLIGQPVMNQDGDNIGEVEDLLITQDGQVDGLVIAVGDFLGIGEKRVGVHMERIELMQMPNGDLEIIVGMTKDELDSTPEYEGSGTDGDRELPSMDQGKDDGAGSGSVPTTGSI